MKKLISILVFILAFSSISLAQSDAKYEKTLKKMFKVSGSEQAYATAITEMLPLFKKQYPDVDSKLWEKLEKEFESTSLNDIVELLVPVYQKHFTIKELKDLISFYESPIGKKLAEKNPAIMKESIEVGQKWGYQIGVNFKKKMEEKGY